MFLISLKKFERCCGNPLLNSMHYCLDRGGNFTQPNAIREELVCGQTEKYRVIDVLRGTKYRGKVNGIARAYAESLTKLVA